MMQRENMLVIWQTVSFCRVIVYSVRSPAVTLEGRSQYIFYMYAYYQQYFVPPPVFESFYLYSADEKTNTVVKRNMCKSSGFILT